MTWCCLWRDVNSSLAWLWTVRRDGRKLLAYYLYMTGLRGNTSFSFFLAFSDLQLCSWHISKTATRPAGGRTWTPAILIGWLHPLQMRTHGHIGEGELPLQVLEGGLASGSVLVWCAKSHLDVEELTTVSWEKVPAKELYSVVPEVKGEECCFVVLLLATSHWVEFCFVEGNP